MAGTKRTLHATLGWIVWKVLAIVACRWPRRRSPRAAPAAVARVAEPRITTRTSTRISTRK